MTTISQLLYMNGHGIYIFSAYGLVIASLILQWLIPWWRLKKHLRNRPST